MKITWIGQAGLLIRHGDKTILVDPYLSDSCFEKNPQSHRRVPVDESLFELKPDMILLTHDHLDHVDMQTLERYLDTNRRITVLAPTNAWQHVRAYGHGHNYVMLNRHSVWSECDLAIYAVHAEHSDQTAVGYVLDDGEHTCYISGDTLYNYDVIDDVLTLFPEGVDVAIVPINGVGNNMNAEDAADFAADVYASFAVPVHYGLFDALDPRTFSFPNRIIPEMYREIPLPF